MALAPTLFLTYYPSYSINEFLLTEILTTISAAVVAVVVLSSGVFVSIATAIFEGFISEYTNYLGTITSPGGPATESGFAV